MRISDWSSDVCSSDLTKPSNASSIHGRATSKPHAPRHWALPPTPISATSSALTCKTTRHHDHITGLHRRRFHRGYLFGQHAGASRHAHSQDHRHTQRRRTCRQRCRRSCHEVTHHKSAEHTSALQSLISISYAVVCFK